MKNIFLIILITLLPLFTFSQNSNNIESKIKVSEETNDGLIVEFNLGSYYFEEVQTTLGNAIIIKSPGCTNSYFKGAPDLPFFTRAINIPPKGNVKCEVISSEYILLENILVAPSRGSIMRNVNPDDIPFEYGKEYLINQFFPEFMATMSSPYIIRNIRGSSLNIIPFEYNPVTRELRIYTNIVVKIVYDKNEKSENEILESSTNTFKDEEFSNLYNRFFLNNLNNIKYIPLEDGTPGKMLIIAKDEFASAMIPFISWKREKGIETILVNKSEVGTTATQIKSFIQDYYDNQGITYVLLVGDGTDIPPMTIGGNDSDNGYAYLSGDDGYVDVFIGRFSGNSIADIQTQVDRTINYEKSLSAQATWLENAFGSASSEGGGTNGHNGGESDLVHLNLIKTKLENYGYTVTDVNQDGGSNNQIINAFNSGMGLANYIGHGDVNMWVNTSFTNTEVNTLTNNYKLPFIFSVACVNGDFKNNTCFAEAWLRATNNDEPTGAVGFLGSTINQSWNEPMTAQDEMNDILVESYENNIKRTYGGLCFNGLFKMIEEGGQGQSMADTWTIFGDPSLMVRTKTPQEMNISHQSTITIGSSEFLVSCNTDGALVSLSKIENDETIIIGYAYVNGGQANVQIIPLESPGNMKVTVTAFNKVTYQANVLAITPDGPYVINGGYAINDETANNNSLADYNETFYLNQTLSNVGIENANDVSASISTSSSDVEILNASADFGIIAADGLSTVQNAFQISVNDGVLDQTIVPITLNITDDQDNSWTSNYNIILNAPDMSISFVSIDDSQGNNNGMIDAGETVLLNVKIHNIGHAVSPEGLLSISCESEYVLLNLSSANVNAILPNDYQELSFEAIANEQTPIGESLCFDFNLETGMYAASLNVCLSCGLQIEDFETADFLSYEWENTSNIPWVIVSDVVYEGEYAAKSGAVPSSGGESSLVMVIDVLNNDNIEFYKKVSCEPAFDLFGYLFYLDYLSFSIDNQEMDKWAGEIDWSLESYLVSSGSHEFKWIYTKNSVGDEGSDCAWLDYIKLPTHQNFVSFINSNKEVAQNTLSVYPNPADNYINIYLELAQNLNATIFIYSVNGQIVYESPQNVNFYKGENSIIINTSSFNNGVYFVKLVSEKESHTQTVVINK